MLLALVLAGCLWLVYEGVKNMSIYNKFYIERTTIGKLITLTAILMAIGTIIFALRKYRANQKIHV